MWLEAFKISKMFSLFAKGNEVKWEKHFTLSGIQYMFFYFHDAAFCISSEIFECRKVFSMLNVYLLNLKGMIFRTAYHYMYTSLPPNKWLNTCIYIKEKDK